MKKDVLYLNVKKQPFDMIDAGIKKEDYRKIKPYWKSRLENQAYTKVFIKNGYRKNSRALLIEFLGIEKGKPNLAWTCGIISDEEVYKVKFGKILERI